METVATGASVLPILRHDSMMVSRIDPLNDPRWTRLVERSWESSVFHTRGWLLAIKQTYGYTPIAYATVDEDKELIDGVVFCAIDSWLTGRRLVSLPFSDHCQPIASRDGLAQILRFVGDQRKTLRQKYVELRPLECGPLADIGATFSSSGEFSFHTIDLRPDLKTIFAKFHDSCIRRKIKRAQREGLIYESGRSPELLKKFRQLFLLTRRRHRLPPQPAAWFDNIVESLGENTTIRVVSKDCAPLASILTLRHKSTLVYKYGCSDLQFSNLGGTPLLFWMAIQEAKASGAHDFDLGRSDLDEPGLLAFKNHLGADRSLLTYYRTPAVVSNEKREPWLPVSAWAREALAHLPDPLLIGIGQAMYRHMG